MDQAFVDCWFKHCARTICFCAMIYKIVDGSTNSHASIFEQSAGRGPDSGSIGPDMGRVLDTIAWFWVGYGSNMGWIWGRAAALLTPSQAKYTQTPHQYILALVPNDMSLPRKLNRYSSAPTFFGGGRLDQGILFAWLGSTIWSIFLKTVFFGRSILWQLFELKYYLGKTRFKRTLQFTMSVCLLGGGF